ncbi:hypothetical protein [Kitasatospora sp. NPDC094015]|uniref:hypothetical protein n=1 Tax=Kitasatospora sp. NPDC094015 TaxID=3155205 RepID=UPI00331765FE
MTESLPDDMADVLALVLDTDDPAHVALRAQIPHVRVESRCGCGCGTAYFAFDACGIGPAPTGLRTVVAAERQLRTESGDCPGEILVFAEGGYLAWLEVCSWSSETEVNLTAARRWLQLSP